MGLVTVNAPATRQRTKLDFMRTDNTRARYSRKRFCYGLAGAGDACEATAYFGSFTCLRTAANNLRIPVRLTRLSMNDGKGAPVSVKMEYVASVLAGPSGSSRQLPSQIFTRTTPFFSDGPSSFAGDQRLV